MLIVLNALRVNALNRRLSRLDVAGFAAGGFIIRATTTSGAAGTAHMIGGGPINWAVAACAVAIAAIPVAAAAHTRPTDLEPFKSTTEIVSMAALAAAFPRSIAGPGPVAVISTMSGLAICIVAGRSRSLLTVPGVLWAAIALLYPCIVDAVVTETLTAAGTITAILTVTTVVAAVAS
jgi:hypothetical protein